MWTPPDGLANYALGWDTGSESGTPVVAKGGEQIMNSAERMKAITAHVQRSSQEQAHGSTQITRSIESINEMVQHLNRAQKEQTVGSEQVLKAVEAMRDEFGATTIVLDPENDGMFTWWAPWRNMKQRNIGWRLDYVLASEEIARRATSCPSYREVGTSDHAPVTIDLDL